ncbi:MAG: hypothetical protein ACOYOJ_12395 [Alsobacter sp.]
MASVTLLDTLPKTPATTRAIRIAILAMGGEGGGVLADWLVEMGQAHGHLAQMTSVPGVAQRTGATIHYVEIFPEAAARVRIPAKPATYSNLMPATYSDTKPATVPI